MSPWLQCQPEGSSPLTRGGRGNFRYPWCCPGLIPAYAGRTWFACASWRAVGAHPRLRGADRRPGCAVIARVGSSPLTRGGRIHLRLNLQRFRLIPAYAGRTTKGPGNNSWKGAHPRLRGADFPTMVAATVSRGSSPLTRGGRATLHTLIASIGLIPAYAGRTPRPLRRGRHAGAHPRLRGADSCLQPHYMPPRGSSPLTRGGQILRDVDNLSAGLIPAYAGRTSVEIPVSRLVGAHPRLRGAD